MSVPPKKKRFGRWFESNSRTFWFLLDLQREIEFNGDQLSNVRKCKFDFCTTDAIDLTRPYCRHGQRSAVVPSGCMATLESPVAVSGAILLAPGFTRVMDGCMVAENQLTTVQARDLARHESIIQDGMVKFIEVGSSLKAIRDEMLYRAKYRTFAAYCCERWGIEKSRAYQLIEASATSAILSTVVDKSDLPANERQCREVAKAPPAKQAEVVKIANEKAKSEDRKPVARDFKEAVQEVLKAEDDAEETLDLRSTTSPAELAVNNASIIRPIHKALCDARRLLKDLPEVPGTEMLVAQELSLGRKIEDAKNTVLCSMPDSVCPKCKGRCVTNGKDCASCGNHGWVNNIMADQLRKERR